MLLGRNHWVIRAVLKGAALWNREESRNSSGYKFFSSIDFQHWIPFLLIDAIENWPLRTEKAMSGISEKTTPITKFRKGFPILQIGCGNWKWAKINYRILSCSYDLNPCPTILAILWQLKEWLMIYVYVHFCTFWARDLVFLKILKYSNWKLS